MHRLILLSLALGACTPANQQVPAKATDNLSEPTPAPLDDEAARVQSALSVRHDPPGCAALTAELQAPREALVQVVETVTMPAWVPMRAAGCLVELYPEQESERLVAWVTDPEWAGAGRLVLLQLDTMPESVALKVGEASLGGPLAELAAERLDASERPALRALRAAP